MDSPKTIFTSLSTACRCLAKGETPDWQTLHQAAAHPTYTYLLNELQACANKLQKEQPTTPLPPDIPQLSLLQDLILSNLNEGLVVTYNLDETILYVNPGLENMLGYTANQLIGKKVRTVNATNTIQDAEKLATHIRQTLIDQGKFSAEIVLQHANGTTLPAKLNATVFDDPILGAISISLLQDMTEQKQQDQRLQKSEEKYQQLIELATEGIWVIDQNNITTYMNPRMATMIGYEIEEALHKHLFDFMDEAGIKICQRNLERRKQGISEDHPFELKHKNGKTIYTYMSTAPITNEAGDFQGTIACVQDITEQKLAQQQISVHRDELARVARINTLSEMATTLAHELNQPLGAISGYTHGCKLHLKKHPPPLQTLQDGLEKIEQQTQRATSIIQQMRSFSKKEIPQKAWLHLNQDIFQPCANFLQAEFKRSGVRLSTQIAPNLPKLFVQPIQIQQVLINLIKNAIEAYEPLEDIEANICIKADTDDKQIVVRILDNASGISDAEKNKLFNTFHTTKQHGIGLGLSICRNIAESHGGLLTLETDPDFKTCFQLTLPIETHDNAMAEQAC